MYKKSLIEELHDLGAVFDELLTNIRKAASWDFFRIRRWFKRKWKESLDNISRARILQIEEEERIRREKLLEQIKFFAEDVAGALARIAKAGIDGAVAGENLRKSMDAAIAEEPLIISLIEFPPEGCEFFQKKEEK